MRIVLTAFVGAVFGLAVVHEAYFVAITVFATGLILHMVLREFHRDVIIVDERIVRIYDRASAQALRAPLTFIGFIYTGITLLRSLGFTLNNLYSGLKPFVYAALALILHHLGFYTYYKRKM